jgi:hypothetical protein
VIDVPNFIKKISSVTIATKYMLIPTNAMGKLGFNVANVTSGTIQSVNQAIRTILN